ncbi:hydro-lyase, Fe-S type, tartrate/fumarate subfamily, alpha subunit [Methanocaldococcus infernus ME]|uniref:Hydro-lyase, Fe-S type, tartrate/fumarate subfamily, alpha subunit n=1 Tax=Methanocaldococcus infernus (strain DSM 11812 / JCM 15783 / ME) TaxID=573063 RepID=D5VSD4_METIM|nr:fumarate hydratase [Methanocaldococcus infernus]ADG13487.1 hydro-lyase, Fe-S type, tartrate/fumarate subfamily, alpha subunit [Methanocaldococcus infernus ME]
MIQETVIELFREAVVKLPEDVKKALKESYEKESSKLAKETLKAILKNIEIAERENIPLCQDTGLPIVFLKIGRGVKGEEVLKIVNEIREGVKRATEEIPLRPNVVHPISRENLGNVGLDIPYISYEFDHSLEKEIEITVFPKGAGSENMSALKMLTPAEGVSGIKKFVLETVVNASGKPCPPIVVGIGIGGSSDLALKLAKKALLRKIGERHRDEEIAKLEEELLKKINSLGIGAMGLGGEITALDVFIEVAGTHTASLPVGICINCWAHRRATRRLKI